MRLWLDRKRGFHDLSPSLRLTPGRIHNRGHKRLLTPIFLLRNFHLKGSSGGEAMGHQHESCSWFLNGKKTREGERERNKKKRVQEGNHFSREKGAHSALFSITSSPWLASIRKPRKCVERIKIAAHTCDPPIPSEWMDRSQASKSWVWWQGARTSKDRYRNIGNVTRCKKIGEKKFQSKNLKKNLTGNILRKQGAFSLSKKIFFRSNFLSNFLTNFFQKSENFLPAIFCNLSFLPLSISWQIQILSNKDLHWI